MKQTKKKAHNLVKKGEAKEAGGEMDTFVLAEDEQPTATRAPAAAATRHHVVVPPQLATTPSAAPLTMPAQVPHPPRNPKASEEERRVAVKIEENAKVSKEMAKKQWNGAKKTKPTVIELSTISMTQPPQMPTFPYKDDQWSPVNPDGKKQYDRSFLLAQQDNPLSIRKPEGLPKLEIIKDVYSKPMSVDRTQGYSPSRSIGPLPDFTPGYLKSSARGRTSQPGRKCSPAKDEPPTVTRDPAAAATRHHIIEPPQPAPTPSPPTRPAQVSHPPRNPKASEEERKMAVKIEENSKVSKEMAKKQWNGAKKTKPTVIELSTISMTQPPQMPTFHYKEDQWSPVNPDGKKQYDRSFLLAQQDNPLLIRKPEGLPKLEIIKDAYSKPMSVNHTPGYSPSRSVGLVPDFTPGYLKYSATGRMSQLGRKCNP